MMSAVTANQAANAAAQNAPYLTADHIYADLNSVSPGLKQSIARVIEGFRRPVRRNRDDGSRSALRPQSADAGGRQRRAGVCR